MCLCVLEGPLQLNGPPPAPLQIVASTSAAQSKLILWACERGGGGGRRLVKSPHPLSRRGSQKKFYTTE